MADDGSLFGPILIWNEENTSSVHLIGVLKNVKFLELLMIETKLLDELRIAKNQEWTITDVGQVRTLIRVLLQHIFDESVAVTILLYALLLDTVETSKGRNVQLESRVHFFEPIGTNVELDDKFINEPYNDCQKDDSKYQKWQKYHKVILRDLL